MTADARSGPEGSAPVPDVPAVRPGRRTTRRSRGSLSAAEILQAAFELVETGSVDALSMPRLARHLDIGVMTVYWYFKNKEDLLDAMTAAALQRFYALLPHFDELPWDEHLLAHFREFRRIFRADHVLCDLVVLRVNHITPENIGRTWDRFEGVLAALVAAGMSREEAAQAYFSLSVYTRGCVMIERMFLTSTGEATRRSMRTGLRADDANRERYPLLWAQSEHDSFAMVRDTDFEFGLRTLVAGLVAGLVDRLSGRSRPARPPANAADKSE